VSLQTLLVCDADLSTRRQIESLITGAPELLYVGTCEGPDAQRYINNSGAKFVWIDLGKDPTRSLTLLGDLKHACPGVHFLVSHEKWDPGMEKMSTQLGAFEFLDPLTWGEKWIHIIKALQAYELEQKAPPAVSPRTSQPRQAQTVPAMKAPVTDGRENLPLSVEWPHGRALADDEGWQAMPMPASAPEPVTVGGAGPDESPAQAPSERPKFSASRTGMPAMKAAKFLPKWFIPATVAVAVLTIASYFIFH